MASRAKTVTKDKAHGEEVIVVMTVDAPFSVTNPGFIARETQRWGTDEVKFTSSLWLALVYERREEALRELDGLRKRTKRQLLTHAAVFKLRSTED